MNEQNTFNFDNIGQGLSPIFDPSKNFFQGKNNVLQASAGFGSEINDNQINTQNNILHNNTLDSKNIFGETLKTETTHIPEFYGNTVNETNNIENNNFITNKTNNDNNEIFAQVKVIPSNTTDINNYFTQSQGNQETQVSENNNNIINGETQVLPGTNSNTFFSRNQIGETNNQVNYGQIPTSTKEPQNVYTTYQNSGTENINNINFGTTETQTLYNPISVKETTQQIIQQTGIPQYQNIQNLGQIDYEDYPASNESKLIQFFEHIKDHSSQPVVQFQNTETNITSYPYQENAQNNIVGNPPQIISQDYHNFANIDINQYQTQEKKIFGNKSSISKLIEDEDFRRGRPIYNDIANPVSKLRFQKNQVGRTYKVRDIVGHNPNTIGLSKLTPSMSYNIDELFFSKNNNYKIGGAFNSLNNIDNNLNTIEEKVNNNINSGLEKLTKSSSYNVGNQYFNPILSNVGLNQFQGSLNNN